MIYETKEIGKRIKEEIKKNRYSLDLFAQMAKTTRPTLTGWVEKDMPLSKFLEICHLLKLSPSSFFLENNGVIQTTNNSKNVNQSANSGMEVELLRQENKYLKEQIELYKKLMESKQ